MLSRTLLVVLVLSLVVGAFSFGCATGSQRPAMQARGKSAVPEPTPVPAPTWTPVTPAAVPITPNTVAAVQPAGGPPLPPPGATPQGTTPVATPQAATPVSVSDGNAKVHELYRQATASYAGIDSYIARLRRHETVNGRDRAEEILYFKCRKQPFSVYFKWLGEEGKGREAVYVQGKYDSKLHTLLAAGDVAIFPAGKRLSLDPDSSLVRANSRHSVTEAGIGNLIKQFGRLVAAQDTGVMPPMKYLGTVKRPDYEAPLEGVEQTIVPKLEPDFAQGGTRLWFFDPTNHLPVLIVTRNARGHEDEYYCYDRIQYPVRLDDDDFNPDKLWGRR